MVQEDESEVLWDGKLLPSQLRWRASAEMSRSLGLQAGDRTTLPILRHLIQGGPTCVWESWSTQERQDFITEVAVERRSRSSWAESYHVVLRRRGFHVPPQFYPGEKVAVLKDGYCIAVVDLVDREVPSGSVWPLDYDGYFRPDGSGQEGHALAHPQDRHYAEAEQYRAQKVSQIHQKIDALSDTLKEHLQKCTNYQLNDFEDRVVLTFNRVEEDEAD